MAVAFLYGSTILLAVGALVAGGAWMRARTARARTTHAWAGVAAALLLFAGTQAGRALSSAASADGSGGALDPLAEAVTLAAAALLAGAITLFARGIRRASETAGFSYGEAAVRSERSRLVVDIASDWLWETDENDRFIWLSDQVEPETGLPPSWYLGKTRTELLRSGPQSPEIGDHIATVARREPFRNFVSCRRGPNGDRWVETNGVPKFDADGAFRGYLGTGRDVTETVSARREANRSRQLLFETVDNVGASISLWGPDDRLILSNRIHRETHRDIPETLEPGTLFEDFIRARAEKMIYDNHEIDEDGKKAWLDLRRERHRNPGAAYPVDFRDGRRHLVRECRLEDGSTITAAVDVTDLKRSEENVRQSQNMLRSILDALPVSISMVDRLGRYTYINRVEADRWGVGPESVIGRSAYDVLTPEIAETAREEDRHVLATGEPIPFFEEKVRIGDREQAMWIGKIPIQEADGSVSGVCMIGLDVTDRVEAMEALRQSGLDYRRTLEMFPEAVYLTIDGSIVFANQAARKLFDPAGTGSLEGMDSCNLFQEEERETVERNRRGLTDRRLGVADEIHRFARLDGREFTGEGSATAVTWEGRNAILVVVRDVTEKERRNAEIVEARRNADRANRAKSEFLASMSHEIRTPLNGILGMATILQDGDLRDEQRKHIETIRKSGNLLLSLLNDILDLSKIEAGGLDLESLDFDLPALLGSVADLWAPKATAQGLAYVQSLDGVTVPVLRSDPTRIHQVLFNLLSNALKFTATGEVGVSVAQRRTGDGLVVTRFTVHDTGEGIAPDKLTQVFAKFAQADSSITRRHGGTGLGLAISRELAEAMGGEIGVESAPGEGSRFWFSIVCPAGDAERVREFATAADAPGTADRQLRILVAEDNQVNQSVIRLMLEKAGHRVDIVANGRDAVEAVARQPYDAVLMDVQMPEMDGVTATRHIRDLPEPGNRVPVIALTANAMKGDRDRYLGAGMDDYVSKPIDPGKMTAALRRQCGLDAGAPTLQVPLPQAAPARPPADADLDKDLAALIEGMDRDGG